MQWRSVASRWVAGRLFVCAARSALASLLVTGACVDPGQPGPTVGHATLIRKATVSSSEVLLSTVKSLSANSRYVFLQLASEQSVLVFSLDGRYVRTIGRFGAGPGEFDELVRMGLHSDTLWTLDWGLRRLSQFLDTGELLSTAPFRGPASSAEAANFYFLQPESLTPSGALLGRGGTSLRLLTEGLVVRSPILYGYRDGNALDTIGWYSLRNSGLFLRGVGGPQPIPNFDLVVYDGPGEKACVLQRDHLVQPSVVNATVTCLGIGADTLWRRSLAFEVTPVPSRVADSMRERYYEVLPNYPKAEIDAALHIPAYWPPVTDILAGADGSVWLRGAAERDSVTYSVIDRFGVDRVPVRVPKTLRIRWADGDVVWAEELDDDDVPTVSRFMIIAPRDSE